MIALGITALICLTVLGCWWLHLQSVRLTSRLTQRTLDEADKARDELAKVLHERGVAETALVARLDDWEHRLDGLEKRELKRGMR